MVIAVLISLGTIPQKMAVFCQEAKEGLTAVVFQGTGFISGNFSVNFGVEFLLPFGNAGSGREGVELCQDAASIQTVSILLLGGKGGDQRLCILAVDPP